jgi:hypothetical protein
MAEFVYIPGEFADYSKRCLDTLNQDMVFARPCTAGDVFFQLDRELCIS